MIPATIPLNPTKPSASPAAVRNSKRIEHPPASKAKFMTRIPYTNALHELSGFCQRNSRLLFAAINAPNNTPMGVRTGNTSDAGATSRCVRPSRFHVQFTRSRAWQAMQMPYASGGRTSNRAPARTARRPAVMPIGTAVMRIGRPSAGASPSALPEGEGAEISLVPIIGSRFIEMNAVYAHALRGEKRDYVFAFGILKSKRNSAIGTEVLLAGNEFGREPVARQQRLGADCMMRSEKTDQAVHVVVALLWAQAEIFRSASRAASTSAGVLDHPKLKRTVPAGKVPSVW